MDTVTFPPDEVCLATRDLFDLLEELATSGWQDLAVVHSRMSSHEIFSTPPFSDNTFGFFDFKRKVLASRNEAPSREVERALLQARADGDKRTATVLAAIHRQSCSVASPLYRTIHETHGIVSAVATALSTSSLQALSTSSLQVQGTLTFAVGGAGTPATSAAEVATVGAPRLATLAPACSVVPSDPATWPSVSANGILPTFATSYEFVKVRAAPRVLVVLLLSSFLGLLLSTGEERSRTRGRIQRGPPA